MIEPTEADVGRAVLHHGPHFAKQEDEVLFGRMASRKIAADKWGNIDSITLHGYVWVDYGPENGGILQTEPKYLDWAD